MASAHSLAQKNCASQIMQPKKNLRTVAGPQVFPTTIGRVTSAATSFLILPDARAHPAPNQKLKLYST